MAEINQKLKWGLMGQGFNLKLIYPRPDSVDLVTFAKLLTAVEDSSANWREDMHFNTRASDAFKEWFGDPSEPLPEYAYALLSNWFLTRLKFIRESPRGHAALAMWNALFCAVPEGRLTDPKRNDKVLPEVFGLWWDKQLKCQENK